MASGASTRSSEQLWGGPSGPQAARWPASSAADSATLPSAGSKPFVLSVCIHGGLVGLLALSSGIPSAAPRSLYDQEIRPYEHKLIWYSLKNRTPDVRPTETKKTPRPPRALRKFDQSLIAGVKEDARPPQKVWIPDAPKVDPPKLEPLPNLLAIAPAPKRPLRDFQPPPDPQAKPKPAPVIPEAPPEAPAAA